MATRSALVVATVIALSVADAAQATSRSELGALKLLFWATEGAQWANTWDVQRPDADPCIENWYGIRCDDDGHIISIRLPRNNLIGYIPVEDLSSNFLTGAVPASISRLTSLRVLRLDNNWFIGKLPSSLSQLSDLEYLHVQNNQFDLGANNRVVPDVVQLLGQTNDCHIIE
ncbi:hypothetical protein P43SY_003799 [Pythium insidiosum]|uniref:Leucine-rich repeat-containing N-terminal plant-type domain-containing protein n=1 Tax=Pythium insidiosum TaxID=114742 RepID=A0AAD5LMC5_PYTIN|nr:hypothetical protein P43SY_003799 [Pythium insidiosum]